MRTNNKTVAGAPKIEKDFDNITPSKLYKSIKLELQEKYGLEDLLSDWGRRDMKKTIRLIEGVEFDRVVTTNVGDFTIKVLYAKAHKPSKKGKNGSWAFKFTIEHTVMSTHEIKYFVRICDYQGSFGEILDNIAYEVSTWVRAFYAEVYTNTYGVEVEVDED